MTSKAQPSPGLGAVSDPGRFERQRHGTGGRRRDVGARQAQEHAGHERRVRDVHERNLIRAEELACRRSLVTCPSIAESRRQPQVAIDEYLKEIAAHPKAFKAAFNLAKVYEQLGNRASQESSYREAIEMNPNVAEGHIYLAKLYLDDNREFDRAIALARKGIEIDPASPYAPLGHYVLADIYSRRGMMAESQREAQLGQKRERATRQPPSP